MSAVSNLSGAKLFPNLPALQGIYFTKELVKERRRVGDMEKAKREEWRRARR